MISVCSLAVRGVSYGSFTSLKAASRSSSDLSQSTLMMEEDDGELIQQDGVMEEYLAIDYGLVCLK